MTASTSRTGHHHGNLREALVEAGIEMLEAGETFSLRAAARRVGVSQAAPYRHFANKESLETAMAASGFIELRHHLERALVRADGDIDEPPLAALAIAYVAFAASHPALYRLMHERACNASGERLPESADVFEFLEQAAATRYPKAHPNGLATAGWALAHGFASLHLDGQIALAPGTSIEDRIRAALATLTPPEPDRRR